MKGLIITALVAVVAVVGLLLFFRAPSEEPPAQSTPEVRKFTNQVYGYSIEVPDGFNVELQSEHSALILPEKKAPSFGPANFIYVSAVPPELRNSDAGTIYNYNPAHYDLLISLDKEGQSVNLAENDVPALSEWFTYTLAGKAQIDKGVAKNFENTKPWEFPEGTTENRFIYDTGNTIYILGYYTGGSTSDTLDPRVAHSIILSFKTENEDPKSQVITSSPLQNETITSPLTISGLARGTWFFEASFPVYLYDETGTELAVSPAETSAEWMTENFIAFGTTLSFQAPETKTGYLVLEKDNPSGLPEHAAEVKIPVRFSN